MLWIRAALRSWTDPGSAGDSHTNRPWGSARTWTLTPWALVLAGVMAAVVGAGNPVDRDQGAVQDHVGQAGDPAHDLSQSRCGRGKQLDHLVDVAADGGDPDAEPAGEPSVGVAIAQVSQHEQRLLPRRQPAPPAAHCPAVADGGAAGAARAGCPSRSTAARLDENESTGWAFLVHDNRMLCLDTPSQASS